MYYFSYFSYGEISTVGFTFRGNLQIGDVIVSCSKLALRQLFQIQVTGLASEKTLKFYIYIKSSSLLHHQLAK